MRDTVAHPENSPPVFRLDFSGRDTLDRAEQVRAQMALTDPADHVAHARLASILAGALVATDPPGAHAAAEVATRHADISGLDDARAWALLARSARNLSPSSLTERLSTSREVLALAASGVEPHLADPAFFILLGSLAEAGNIAELDVELGVLGPTLSGLPHLDEGRHVAWFRCMRATLDGHLGEAERLAEEGLRRAYGVEDPDAEAVYGGQIAVIRWQQGRASDVEDTFLAGRQLYPGEPVWTAALAWIWLHQGRPSAAAGLVSSMPRASHFPQDRNWLVALAILADVVAQLGETERAHELYELLLPFESHLATIGLGVTFWGTVARPLALLARCLGRGEQAIAHYRVAADVCARVGAQAWLAEAHIGLAQLLGEQRPGSREALALAREAARTAHTRGFPVLAQSADVLVATLEGTDAVAPTSSRPVIELLGGFRVVGSDGAVARWQSRKAREFVKVLAARRGEVIERAQLMHLLWPDEEPAVVANRFAVAASTVRRTLDPLRSRPRNWFVETTGSLVRLRCDRLTVDAEVFLVAARDALNPRPGASPTVADLRAVLDLAAGEVLVDEPEALWAQRFRDEVATASAAVAHAMGEAAHRGGDEAARVEAYRAALAVDAYDERAHLELIDALHQLGAQGQAAEATAAYVSSMGEVGVSLDEVRSSDGSTVARTGRRRPGLR